MTKLPVFCGKDCGGDACPLLALVEGGKVVGIEPNPAGGRYARACAKGFDLPRIHYSEHRLRKPLLRTGPRGSGMFKEIPWTEALALARRGIGDCLERGGPTSILDLSSGGSTGALHDTGRLTRRFLNLLGGCSSQVGNYSSNAANHVLGQAFGSDYEESGLDPASMSRSAMIVLLGANVLEARLGAELSSRLIEASARGARIVCIDPRLTSTARTTGAEWIPLRPGTDAAILYALIRQLDREDLIDGEYVSARARGFELLLRHVRGIDDGIDKTLSWASGISGVELPALERLAEAWASVKPLLLLPGYSIQRSTYGEEVMRLCVALQLASGNFGLEGGSTGSLNNRRPRPRVGRIAAGEPLVERRFPVLRWPDLILGGAEAGAPGGGVETGNARIRCVYAAGSNYLNQGADVGKNVRALSSVDFMVCHELFLTPTARFADLVLPVASPLQKEDLGIPWDGDYLLYKTRILPYEGQERSDFEIFRELADAFGLERRFSEGLDEEGWVDRLLAESEVEDTEAFKREGVYFGKRQRPYKVRDFAEDPVGHPLGTASGKLELGGGERVHFSLETRGGAADFLLVTPKRADRVHSQRGQDGEDVYRGELEMRPEDAEALGLSAGEEAVVTSGLGSLVAVVRIEPGMARGVVSLHEGTWHRLGEDLSAGRSASPNLLSSTEGTRESSSCVMHALRVRVERAGLQSLGTQRPPSSSSP